MTVPILCLVAFVLVLWILLLMSENQGLKKDVTKLKRELRDRIEQRRVDVDVKAGRKLSASEVARETQNAMNR